MSPARWRRAGIAALVVTLLVLHQDLWLWRDGRVVLGLPVGLAYHVAFCLVVAGVMALAVRWAWPSEANGGQPAGPVGSRFPRDVLADSHDAGSPPRPPTHEQGTRQLASGGSLDGVGD